MHLQCGNVLLYLAKSMAASTYIFSTKAKGKYTAPCGSHTQFFPNFNQFLARGFHVYRAIFLSGMFAVHQDLTDSSIFF